MLYRFRQCRPLSGAEGVDGDITYSSLSLLPPRCLICRGNQGSRICQGIVGQQWTMETLPPPPCPIRQGGELKKQPTCYHWLLLMMVAAIVGADEAVLEKRTTWTSPPPPRHCHIHLGEKLNKTICCTRQWRWQCWGWRGTE